MKLLACLIGFPCVIALAHTPNGPGTVALIWVIAVCLVTLTVERRPAPPAFEADLTLSRLDRLDGVGNRTNGETE